MRSWRDYVQPRFLSAVPAVAARFKLPIAQRPGLSQENVNCTKEMTKEIGEERERPPLLGLACRRHEVGRGEEKWWLVPVPAPRPPPPASPGHRVMCGAGRTEMPPPPRVFCHGRMEMLEPFAADEASLVSQTVVTWDQNLAVK